VLAGRARDVRREGNFTDVIEQTQDVLRAAEAKPAMAFSVLSDNRLPAWSFDTSNIAQNNFCSDAGAFAGAQHGPPIVWGIFLQ